MVISRMLLTICNPDSSLDQTAIDMPDVGVPDPARAVMDTLKFMTNGNPRQILWNSEDA
jgi:hypothetical protein